jgi:hypothetical protein
MSHKDAPPETAEQKRMREFYRPLHYWTGYGTLCFTTDARKRDSQVAPDRARVTCERCLTLLARLDSTTDQQGGA